MLRLLNFSFNGDIHCFFLLQTSKSAIHRFCLPQGNIFISNPLSLLYMATLSDPILYLSFTRQHFHIQSFISPLHGNIVWSYPHTHKTEDRVTRTPLKTGGELRCSRRVSSSCSTSGTHCVNLVTNPVISHEWGKDRDVVATSGTYLFSYPILYLSFTLQHCLILSFISPLQGNIFICNPLSLLYKATFSYPIL
jgi:hypothetical protein